MMLLLPIPMPYMLRMNIFYNIMRNWFIKSWNSFRTIPCPPLICPISDPLPPVFQHPSNMIFHQRGIPQFQLIPTETLQVTCHQHCNLHLLQTFNLISLSHIHPMLQVYIKVTSPQIFTTIINISISCTLTRST